MRWRRRKSSLTQPLTPDTPESQPAYPRPPSPVPDLFPKRLHPSASSQRTRFGSLPHFALECKMSAVQPLLVSAPAPPQTQNRVSRRKVTSLRPRPQPLSCGDKKQDLKGQTVVVVGLGVSGRSAAKLALTRGASVLAVDKSEHILPLEHDPLFEEYTDVQTVLGFNEDVLPVADRVVVSPGVPLERYGLAALLRSERQVMSELDFAAEALPPSVKILVVSGTNGKSTVTTFSGQMLHHLGIRAFVGGNLGTPLSDAAVEYLKSSSAHDKIQVAVVEVSSYQMVIPHKHFRPSVSVVLNLTPDHLERHKRMQSYAEMKCRLFSNMRSGKLAVLPIGNQYLDKAFCEYASKCNVAWIGSFPGIMVDTDAKVANFRFPNQQGSQLQLKDLHAIGKHNYQNTAVSAFAVVGLDVGVDAHSIDGIVGRLTLLPHRMQVVCRDTHGVTWVDDSKATNVEATYAGLMGLTDHKLVVLLGGLAKVVSPEISSGFKQLVEPLKCHRGVVMFGHSGGMIHEALCNGGLTIPCIRATNLEDAVNHARQMAQSGLFSLHSLLNPDKLEYHRLLKFSKNLTVARTLHLSQSWAWKVNLWTWTFVSMSVSTSEMSVTESDIIVLTGKKKTKHDHGQDLV